MTRAEAARTRRRYDSRLRREQAAETRDRIVAAGADLLRELPVWHWQELTVRAVAERARVSERTVYRHFDSERALRDAVLARLEAESDVRFEDLRLEDVKRLAAQVLGFVSAFPVKPRTPREPRLNAARARQQEVLVDAVGSAAGDWSDRDRTIAAAMLDVLWSVGAYERLVAEWELEPDDAIEGATWVVGLVEEAIREGRRPSE